MALGDGIRRNIAQVSQAERDRFLAAILKMDRDRFFPDGVSYFDKQEDIHKNAHAAGANVHVGPAFIPWHRELCNRFEALLREVDPDLSLHYWDWTVDPRNAPDGAGGSVSLFTPTFMGGTGNPAGAPFADFESTEPGHTLIWREVGANFANPDGTPAITSDASIKSTNDFRVLDLNMRGPHGNAHGYVGGSLSDAHFSFHDPFVFLLHSNLDRIWAEWQTEPGHTDRLAPTSAYGSYSADPAVNEDIQPWAGDVGTGTTPLRPWAPPDNMQVHKMYKDLSVVTPPCYDTLPTLVQVVTTDNPGMQIRFDDVPESETAIRAAVFEIRACGEITLSVTGGPNAPFSIHQPVGGVLTVPHHPQLMQIGRIWFRYTAGPAGVPVPPSDVTIHCAETGQDFVFHLRANSIARPTVAVMLTLDQSGSMNLLAGTDATTRRIDILHQAATNFVQLVQDNNAVGIVSFDHQSHPGTPVTTFTGGGAFDPARVTAITTIQGIAPAGATSIGNGLQLARNTLNPVTGFDQKAVVVFTDGLENTPLWISDVSGSINNRTFAVGLGTAQQVSAGALTSLANNTNGYLLLSGPLSPSIDDYFRLSKYFLQVLAGVTNTDIVTDPSGYLSPGIVLRIPFDLNEADIDATVVLLNDLPVFAFGIETPDGSIMRPQDVAGVGATFRATSGMDFFRFNLPLVLNGKPHHEGTWYAVLALGGRRGQDFTHVDPSAAKSIGPAGARYSVTAQSLSNLRMRAHVSQSSMQPGARVALTAVLTEYGVPVEQRATVQVGIEAPGGTSTTLQLVETEPGTFEGSFVASASGVYRFHVRASGGTMRGRPFTREQLLSAIVVQGGDNPPPTSQPGRDDAAALCELLSCLRGNTRLIELLRARGIDPGTIERCIKQWCGRRLGELTPEQAAEREGTSGAPTAPPAPGDASQRLLTTLVAMLRQLER